MNRTHNDELSSGVSQTQTANQNYDRRHGTYQAEQVPTTADGKAPAGPSPFKTRGA